MKAGRSERDFPLQCAACTGSDAFFRRRFAACRLRNSTEAEKAIAK
jgi:hypothetical protein